MASYLQVQDISKSYGTKVLLDKVSFNINEGDKIALIAPNGTGKSTLLSILAGKDSSDIGGSIVFLKEISISFLEQDYIFNPKHTIFQEVFYHNRELSGCIEEYESALKEQEVGIAEGDKNAEGKISAEGNIAASANSSEKASEIRLAKAIEKMDTLNAWGYEQQIKEVLTSLRFSNYEQPMTELSGGEVKKIALANVFVEKADFLILDEPTNHLDIEIIEYLEDYLSKSKSTLFMVTHDRYFLDRVCNTILELDGGQLYSYKGNYSYFLEKRAERIANVSAEIDKAQNLYKRELEWIRRTPSARTGKAKYRVDAFDDIKEKAHSRTVEKQIKINVSSSRLGTKIINFKDVSFYWEDRCMLDRFTYNFAKGEKIGIIGGNGVGKSTFLNLVTEKYDPTSGEIERGETISFGYFDQKGISFNENQTLLEAVQDIAEVVKLGDGNTVGIGSFLNYFLFPPHTHNTKISRLSGGEKRRLYLLTVLMRNPNFLILDEPTNDLDIMTLNVLEDYLVNFQGCILIVSHDRYFLDKLADHTFIFQGNGRVKDFVGKSSEYLSNGLLHSQTSSALSNSSAFGKAQKAGAMAAGQKSSESAEGKGGKVKTQSKPKLSFAQKREFEEIEKNLPILNAEKQGLENQLSTGTLSSDELMKASTRIAELIDQMAGT